MGGEDNRVEIIEYEVLVRSKPIQAKEAQKQLAGIWEGEYSSTLATWCIHCSPVTCEAAAKIPNLHTSFPTVFIHI